MEHHRPHPNAAVEGYYNKFDLPSGARLCLVISHIAKAKTRPFVVSFVYIPNDASRIYHKEIFPDTMTMRILDKDHAFALEVPAIGHVKWNADSTTEYVLEHECFTLRATTTSRCPWSESNNTPEGLLIKLPLPLHWHVQSLASSCKFSLTIPGYDLPSQDTLGEAVVHQEKNWAFSFPSAHMWIQAREGDRGLCCAGGQILGMEAFLLGYRSEDLSFDFRPPFTVRFAGLSPFMSHKASWEDRSSELSIQNFRRKITVTAVAPKGTFFSLSPPFADGHRDNFLGESFHARVEVKIYESGWFGAWRLIREDIFQRASLEFGGAYYPPAGSKECFN